MGYVLAVTWVARPGEEAKVEQILRTMVPLTQAEPGCIQYEAFRSTENPRQFLIFEHYQDEAAFQAHSDSKYFKKHVLEEAVPILERRERAFYRSLE